MSQAPTPRSERAARPVILTVDDDPTVSRAVARDLRRNYGEHYRIMRAVPGAEALEGIKEVVLRGEQVAVILADYRMPGMNGVEFLEAAMDLVPQARRALLTAYADTNAAIAAINVVDVDHYLLKPWEPPEEKFYPVVDELLAAWQRAGKPADRKIKILGHPWSAASYEVRDFLARNMVPYRWYNVADPDGARLLAAAGVEASQVPVVITIDGTPLVQPNRFDLANAVGLSTTPTGAFYDVIVVGSGPRSCGVRHLRGSQDRGAGAFGHRRAGRPELADRELPRLSRRGGRRPADRPGPAAGAAFRGRDAHRPYGRRSGGSGLGPAGALR